MKRRIYEGTPGDVYAEHGGLFASRKFPLQRLENSITVRILEGDFAPLVRQALGAAIRVRDAELVDALLSDTALEIIAGETGVELLCDAIDAHSAEMIQLLLRHGADPNAMTSNQWYAWNATLRAAARGEVEIVQVLVEGGGDPDIQDWEGRTPLSYAAEGGHVGVVRLLLGYGVDVFSRDAVRGWRALDWAVQEGMTGVVEILEPLTEGGLVSLLEDSTV
jgi:ankyrin repeat protein